MDMTACSLQWGNSFRPLLVNAVSFISLSAIPRREREEVQAELSGIWKQVKQEDALVNLNAFQAKYAQHYPEAVRSLMEDAEHLLTFYDFPASMHRHIQT